MGEPKKGKNMMMFEWSLMQPEFESVSFIEKLDHDHFIQKCLKFDCNLPTHVVWLLFGRSPGRQGTQLPFLITSNDPQAM